MNERIEKLFDQALEEFKAENKYATIVVPDSLQRDFVGKFALLIVQECAAEADKQTIYCKGIPWGKWIEQHFGVDK